MDTFLRLHAEPSSPSSWLSHMPANCPNPTRHPQICNVNFIFIFFITADAHDRSTFQLDTGIHIYKLSKASRLKTWFQDIRLCKSCKVLSILTRRRSRMAISSFARHDYQNAENPTNSSCTKLPQQWPAQPLPTFHYELYLQLT